METMEAIRSRRSIRRFKEDSLPRELVNNLVRAACLAPSSKNAQPWRFLVFEGRKRLELLRVIGEALNGSKGSRSSPVEVANTFRAMESAPVVILVFMAAFDTPVESNTQTPCQIADVQSIGACIQNLLLAAVDHGLGALWICDILDVSEAIGRFVARTETLVAAIALGYAAEVPQQRPRRELSQCAFWME